MPIHISEEKNPTYVVIAQIMNTYIPVANSDANRDNCISGVGVAPNKAILLTLSDLSGFFFVSSMSSTL